MTQADIQKRLLEISQTSLEGLQDEAVLVLLTERKNLLVEQARLDEEEQKRKAEEERARQEESKLKESKKNKEAQEKKAALVVRLAEVNKSITPDQDDEQLLALINERKVLEAQLKIFNAGEEGSAETLPLNPKIEPSPVTPTEPEVPKVEKILEDEQLTELTEQPKDQIGEESPVKKGPEKADLSPEAPTPAEERITINVAAPFSATSYVTDEGKVSQVASSDERFVLDSSLQGSEYQGYLSELKGNLNSLGTFLQSLPITAKRNRAFMLEVAKLDPAYAMHYADKDTLKKDETFNVAIAGMNNQRNTGNALSEMLPEMRTGAVLLAGVRNDFRNVRFIRPEMPEYESILALAEKGALESVAALKDAHDSKLLIPPVLQKNKDFMAKVEKLVTH